MPSLKILESCDGGAQVGIFVTFGWLTLIQAVTLQSFEHSLKYVSIATLATVLSRMGAVVGKTINLHVNDPGTFLPCSTNSLVCVWSGSCTAADEKVCVCVHACVTERFCVGVCEQSDKEFGDPLPPPFFPCVTILLVRPWPNNCLCVWFLVVCVCGVCDQIGQMNDELRTAESRFIPGCHAGRITTLRFVCVDLCVLLGPGDCMCELSIFFQHLILFTFSPLSMPLNRVIVPTVRQAAVCVCVHACVCADCCCREQTAVRCVWTGKEHRGPVHPAGCEARW